jgi:hypothetical protein
MYVPGYPPHPFPLARYLPPLAEGVAAAFTEQFTSAGDLLIDPFGQSPRVALEAARLGRRVIVATNNPVLRLGLGAALEPAPAAALRGALTRLADARMGNEHVESYARGLYRSTCPDCGGPIEVDSFLWEHESLLEKAYHCETCAAERTRPVDAADLELAARVPQRGPQYHWALDRAAPPGEPEREQFAEALDAYTPRALNVLFTLSLKSASLTIGRDERRALDILLLMAYDEALSFGPPGVRPRTLKPHARYREHNIWLALERLARDGAWQTDDGEAVGLQSLAGIERGAGVVLHEGSIRTLAQALAPGSARCVMAALPRPNLVLWTLSTVWAGWLWGQAAAAPLRQLIRRRRYDWAWHENALRSGLSAAVPLMARPGRLVALLPEAEAGFVAAALTAADGAGLTLAGHGLRSNPAEAQFVFQPDALDLQVASAPEDLGGVIQTRAAQAAAGVLRERGEPSRWNAVSGAIYLALAGEHRLRQAGDDPLERLEDWVEKACAESEALVTLRPSAGEAEPGRAVNAIWWLADVRDAAAPLADRTEEAVAQALSAAGQTGLDLIEVEKRVCRAVAGTSLPGGMLVRRCLESYGQEHEGLWFFRPEDEPRARAADSEQIRRELMALGQRLGYSAATSAEGEILWPAAQPGRTTFRFNILETAMIAGRVLAAKLDADARVLVIPGGRAGLIDFKVKRDPRLRAALDRGGWLFLKYRHVRRLLAEPALELVDSQSILNRDPITEQRSAQLPLW